MLLNKCSGNMYADVDYTTNPIRGRCPFNCEYCYVKTGFRKNITAYQLPFHLHRQTLENGPDPPEGSTIFVGSMTDMWQAPTNFIMTLMKTINEINNRNDCDGNDPLHWVFQSKDPGPMIQFLDILPRHSTLLTTIETSRRCREISDAPTTDVRVHRMNVLSNTVAKIREEFDYKTGVTVEPIIDFNESWFLEMLIVCDASYINFGAMTMAEYEKYEITPPSVDEICWLVDKLIKKHGIEVRIKKNLMRLADKGEARDSFREKLLGAGAWLTWEWMDRGDNAMLRREAWLLELITDKPDKLHEGIADEMRKMRNMPIIQLSEDSDG